MLSGETSVGGYPVQTVATMARIIVAAESGGAARAAAGARAAYPVRGDRPRRLRGGRRRSGRARWWPSPCGRHRPSARRHRSAIPLLAFTPLAEVRSQLALVWGVETFLVPAVTTTDEMVEQVEQAMLDLGRGERGELIVVVAGSPPGVAGGTNAMRVHRLGDAPPSRAPGCPRWPDPHGF